MRLRPNTDTEVPSSKRSTISSGLGRAPGQKSLPNLCVPYPGLNLELRAIGSSYMLIQTYVLLNMQRISMF